MWARPVEPGREKQLGNDGIEEVPPCLLGAYCGRSWTSPRWRSLCTYHQAETGSEEMFKNCSSNMEGGWCHRWEGGKWLLDCLIHAQRVATVLLPWRISFSNLTVADLRVNTRSPQCSTEQKSTNLSASHAGVPVPFCVQSLGSITSVLSWDQDTAGGSCLSFRASSLTVSLDSLSTCMCR